MPHIDLNCDLGESFGAYTIGMDEKVIPFITSANVACGFHAGDPLVMQRTVALCKQSGAAVGAHPGFPDLQGFGRRQMKLTPAEAKACVQYQIGALKAFCDAAGVPLHHVKPHGALYNMAGKDRALADAICAAVKESAPGAVLLALFIQCCGVYQVLLALFTRLNPLRFLKKFAPVMGFAFSTATSNATIPMNIDTLEEKIGVNRRISSFTIPLGATINMDGTSIMQGVAVVFVAQAFGITLTPADYLTVIATATLASIGTAGVPSVGLITLAMVFDSVGLPVAGIGLIMGIDRILDMARTAVNITGDAVCTTIVAHQDGALDKSVFNKN